MNTQLVTDLSFSLLPVDTEDTASSRIRVYMLSRSLKSLGASVSLEYSMEADVLFIQIGVTADKLDMAREAKARGCLVIYDVDDLGGALWYWVPQRLFYKMVELADIVTTDTEPRRQKLLNDYGVSRVEVLPDAIDYYPSGPVRLPLVESSPLRVVWFGGLVNMEHFEPYIGALSEMRDVQIVSIVMSRGLKHFQDWYPEVEFIPWSRSTFVVSLQSCHISCLMHGDSVEDLTKSNNKFIASVNWGVPVVASRTPEYERTAREAGVAETLFDNDEELVQRVEALRSPAARQAYMDKAQPYVWQHYSPAVVAEQFLNIVARYK
jgi:glycosyltransferase involved in cell wall biosynthesis